MVVIVSTELPPMELLAACLSVEQDLGRVRISRWGPRVIDIDVLLYNEIIMHTDRLILPHPGIIERSFVLIPLLEVAPALVLQNGLTPEQLVRANFADGQGVRLWKTVSWDSQNSCLV